MATLGTPPPGWSGVGIEGGPKLLLRSMLHQKFNLGRLSFSMKTTFRLALGWFAIL